MKRYLILLLFSAPLLLKAQAMLGFGFNSHFLTPDGLNFIVDRYNETRPFLDTEMKHFNNLDGFSYGGYIGAAHLILEMGYNHRSQTRFAEGVDATNSLVRRELRAAINTGFIGLSYAPVAESDGFLSFGVRFELGQLRIRSRVGSVATFDEVDWGDDVFKSLFGDVIFNAKLMYQFICIEPYYALNPSLFGEVFMTDIQEVNQAINPNTYQNDPETIDFNSGGFGIRLLILIGYTM